MTKKFLSLILALVFAAACFGQGRKYYSITFVDEWGDPVTTLTQVDVEDTSGTDTAVYTTQTGSTEYGSTGVITTGLSDGTVEFWYEDTSIDLGCTDGTYTREIESFTNTTYRFAFPTYLTAMAGSSYGQNDDIDFTYASWIIDGDTANRLDMIPDNDDGVLAVGSSSLRADFLLYGNDYIVSFDGSRNQLLFRDNAVLGIGGAADAAGDVTILFDASDLLIDSATASEGMKIGDTTTGFDVTYYFETAGQFRTDYDGDFINLTDDMDLRFGTGASSNGDFQISSNSSNVLAIEQVAADTGTITIGADDHDIPLTWYAETGSDFVLFTADDVQFEDVSLCLADSTQLQFGDPLGTGDFKVYATGTDLIIDGVVADTGTVAIGVTDHGLDFKLWAATNAEGALWDASDEALEFTGANLSLDGSSALIVPDAAVADATPYTLSASTSGHVQVMPDLSADTTINMPAEADGLHYEFIYGGAAADAHDWIFDTGSDTNYFIGGVVQHDPDNAGDDTAVYRSDGNSNSKFTVYTPDVGTSIKFWCNGTQWYINGTVISATDTGAAFADQ